MKIIITEAQAKLLENNPLGRTPEDDAKDMAKKEELMKKKLKRAKIKFPSALLLCRYKLQNHPLNCAQFIVA